MMMLAIALAAAAGAQDYSAIGQCAARSNPRAALAALSADPGASVDALGPVFARCGASAAAPQPLLLGATAEAMMRRYMAGQNVAQMYRRTANTDRSAELMRRGTGGWAQPDAVGTCVARFAPAESQKLFHTRVGSSGEEKAIRALGPALRGCVDTGGTLRSSRAELRAGIARAFYRLYVAPVSDFGL